MHLLIPYIYQRNHADPAFNEFTYGDSNERARNLKTSLTKGDYIFFHTSKGRKKYITAYYVVDRVLDTIVAAQSKAICTKYKNPHLIECLKGKRTIGDSDDVIVFGDPITSNILTRPMLFDKKLAGKLSLGVKFAAHRSETQAIGSATRAWRKLTEQDKDLLLGVIASENKKPKLQTFKSIEEVADTIEKDIEDHIANNPSLIGNGLKLSQRQQSLSSGRLDLLLEDDEGNLIVIEVKLNKVGRSALRQIRGYVHELKQSETSKNVRGVLVCSGVMPAYESDLRKQTDIQIMVYGWDLGVRSW